MQRPTGEGEAGELHYSDSLSGGGGGERALFTNEGVYADLGALAGCYIMQSKLQCVGPP